MAKDGPFNIPTIRGRIAEKLAKATARVKDNEEELTFPDSPAEVTLHTPEERGVVALACLILENLREHGGTRIPERPLETVLRRSLATFGPKETMDIEIEAYEILLWLGNAIDPDWSQQDHKNVDQISPDSSYDDIIRWALGGNHDLEMDYYSRGRGELTHRRVTPISLEAETYLHGYCHLRRDERVFRLSRIADLHPVGGWSGGAAKMKSRPRPEPPPEQRTGPDNEARTAEGADDKADNENDDKQMSLLDD